MEYATRLRLFGPIQVERDGAVPTNPSSRKALALVGYLAVLGQPCARAALADLFWPDIPEARGRANLSWVLNKLSAMLPGALQADLHTIQFRRAACWLDLAAFDQFVAQDDLAALAAAADLYRGELMAGMQLDGCPDFEQWLTVEREHWHQRATHVLQDLINRYERQSAYQDGLRFVSRLLALEPWQEDPHRQRMRLLALSGQRRAALAQYETCRRILADEFGVEPAEETTALYEQIQTGRLAPAGAAQPGELASEAASAHIRTPRRRLDLPLQLTACIGRTAEQQTIASQLAQPDVRLLTIAGLGGIGKSFLALQCATAIAERFRDGVYFVPLASVMATDFLVSTLAETIGIASHSQADPLAQLLSYLHDKEALLVLDNFEHLLEGADVLAMIIQRAPLVKLLVTSQERLNLHEEWVFDLHGLKVPSSDHDPAIEQSSAVQLFVQHARRVRTGFTLTAVNTPFVVQICRLTAGLPLGIVLAAAWVRSLSCQEIAAEIAANLGFLASALRNLPERHRSLRAVFDSCWGRLSEQERDVFAKLAVFHGGVRRPAAEVVAGASAAVLASLVDKSLLQRTPAGRYEIHEMLRRYAADKLALTTETHARAQDQHARYYAAFLHAREVDLRGEAQRLVTEAIGEEIDNIRAGWRWAVARQQFATIELAVDSLFLFYETRGWYQEGDEAFGLTAAALELSERSIEPDGSWAQLLGKVLARQGACALWLAHYDKAIALLECGLALARQLGSRREMAFCLSQLGFARREQGAYGEAERLAQAGLAIARAIDDRWGMALALQYLGLIARSLQRYAEGRQYAQESLALHSAFGNQRGMAFALAVLGFVTLDLGEYAEAQRLLQQSLVACQASGFALGRAAVLHYLGCAAYQQGAYAEAQNLFQTALKRAQEIGYQRGIIRSLSKLGDVAHAVGADHEAAPYYRAALQTARTIAATPLAVDALLGMAALARDAGQVERAMELLTAAMGHLSSTSDRETFDKAERLRSDLAAQVAPQMLTARADQADALTLEVVVQALLSSGTGEAVSVAELQQGIV
jgi:predicted ATPase/DNA-binding SARP family transcriptional activator